AVSGSAMAAWTQGAVKGGVDIGGSLTPEVKVIPWEAQIGATVDNLVGKIQTGSINASIPVNTTIPVLGIRTVSYSGFVGEAGISPQINYGDAVDFSASVNGVAPVTLKMKNTADNSEIGKLTTSMDVVARVSRIKTDGTEGQSFNVFAAEVGQVFYGGVGASGISSGASLNDANTLIPGVTDKFVDFGGKDVGQWRTFIEPSFKYSAVYASAIKAGNDIKLTLNAPASTDEIKWTAQLPVTVFYQ
ncbi:TPA: fimbrial protein, partial [Salmonella enterica subsp. enterica serovar Welikade]